MSYQGRITKAHAMSFGKGIEMLDTFLFEVVWKSEVDGKITVASHVGSCVRSDKRACASLQRKLDDYVKRYASYAERKGFRYEVQRKEKADRKRRIREAPYKSGNAIREAASRRFHAGERVEYSLGHELSKLPQEELEAAAANLLIEVARRAEKEARRQ